MLIESLRSEVAVVRLDAAGAAMAQIRGALMIIATSMHHIISHDIAGELYFAAGPLPLDAMTSTGRASPRSPRRLTMAVISCCGAAKPATSRRGAASVAALARATGAEVAADTGDSTSARRFFGPVRRLLQPALRLTRA